jgi:Copper type II ascorbate-dependent monooxygenase, C-terminal domain/Copper type II ascorbate-dependent monooxygenase, N-terminal domain
VRKAALLAAVVAIAVAGLAAQSGSTTSVAVSPTYYRDVAPILDAKCASCHRLGGIAPFALTTAADAKAHAAGIVQLTTAGLMPPWMPGADSAAIIGRDRRRLTGSELSILGRWSAAGAPAGNPAARHSKPAAGAGLSGPGRTVTLMPPKAYAPHAAGGGIDDYHCFLLDPKLTQDEFVTAALIKPQRTGVVHHVILYEAAGTQATAAEQLNAAHGGQGWSCFGGPNLPLDINSPGSIDRLGQPPWIAAWVPGHTTNALPKGTGVLLHKGARIVMQVHYNLIEASGPDRSSAQLRLRPATTKLIPLETHLVAAPVELPCPDGVTGPQCGRQQAVQDEVTKYGAEAAFIPAALLKICNKTLADFPTAVGTGTSISTSCDRTFTTKQTIYGVAGHMHLRGQDISIVLDPGTPKAQTLLHIPAWIFHWQDVYYLEHPVSVGPGDTVRVSCRFDNSTADQPVIGTRQLTPRYVIWGEGTTDEMCLGMLSVANG